MNHSDKKREREKIKDSKLIVPGNMRFFHRLYGRSILQNAVCIPWSQSRKALSKYLILSILPVALMQWGKKKPNQPNRSLSITLMLYSKVGITGKLSFHLSTCRFILVQNHSILFEESALHHLADQSASSITLFLSSEVCAPACRSYKSYCIILWGFCIKFTKVIAFL